MSSGSCSRNCRPRTSRCASPTVCSKSSKIPVSVEGLALDVSGSVGIALFPSQANDAEALLRRADVAMYAAKENGGGYELYDDDIDRHNPAG